MEAKTFQFDRPPGSFREAVRAHKQRKREWQARMERKEAELRIEVERAKQDPFYRRGSDGMACEPAPMPRPSFKSGSFAKAIRTHRESQQVWQERINRELDELEESRRVAMEKFQTEMELVEV